MLTAANLLTWGYKNGTKLCGQALGTRSLFKHKLHVNWDHIRDFCLLDLSLQGLA